LGREEFREEGNTAIGSIFALLSSFLYGCYSNLMKKMVPDESRLDPFLFLGLVGFVSVLTLWPFFIIFHFTGWEVFRFPSLEQFGYLTLNNIFLTLLSSYLWVVAMTYTSPLTIAIALSMNIPASLLGDYLIHNKIHPTPKYISALLVFIGFLLVNLAGIYEKTDKKLGNMFLRTICCNRDMIRANSCEDTVQEEDEKREDK
jgi:solute carrier family 35 protein F5